MKQIFNNCLDIKGIGFFLLKKSVLTTVVFYTKKDSGGTSIHRINALFPLTPSLVRFEKRPKQLLLQCVVRNLFPLFPPLYLTCRIEDELFKGASIPDYRSHQFWKIT